MDELDGQSGYQIQLTIEQDAVGRMVQPVEDLVGRCYPVHNQFSTVGVDGAVEPALEYQGGLSNIWQTFNYGPLELEHLVSGP
jgi:hypothetical protein